MLKKKWINLTHVISNSIRNEVPGTQLNGNIIILQPYNSSTSVKWAIAVVYEHNVIQRHVQNAFT